MFISRFCDFTCIVSCCQVRQTFDRRTQRFLQMRNAAWLGPSMGPPVISQPCLMKRAKLFCWPVDRVSLFVKARFNPILVSCDYMILNIHYMNHTIPWHTLGFLGSISICVGQLVNTLLLSNPINMGSERIVTIIGPDNPAW